MAFANIKNKDINILAKMESIINSLTLMYNSMNDNIATLKTINHSLRTTQNEMIFEIIPLNAQFLSKRLYNRLKTIFENKIRIMKETNEDNVENIEFSRIMVLYNVISKISFNHSFTSFVSDDLKILITQLNNAREIIDFHIKTCGTLNETLKNHLDNFIKLKEEILMNKVENINQILKSEILSADKHIKLMEDVCCSMTNHLSQAIEYINKYEIFRTNSKNMIWKNFMRYLIFSEKECVPTYGIIESEWHWLLNDKVLDLIDEDRCNMLSQIIMSIDKVKIYLNSNNITMIRDCIDEPEN
jgi:hypothetical protein